MWSEPNRMQQATLDTHLLRGQNLTRRRQICTSLL
jgi:hypothetical protein